MVAQADSLPNLGRIHRVAFSDQHSIRELLDRVRQQKLKLESGLGRRLDREIAWLERIDESSIWLRTENFDLEGRERVALTFLLDGEPYLITAQVLGELGRSLVRLSVPGEVFRVERRERVRRLAGEPAVPRHVDLRWGETLIERARVLNYSEDGLGVQVRGAELAGIGAPLEVVFCDGPEAGVVRSGLIRRRKSANSRGWHEVGLSLTVAPPGPLIPVDRRERIVDRGRRGAVRAGWRTLSAGARLAVDRRLSRLGRTTTTPSVDVVRFQNRWGREIVALRDGWQSGPGTPVVLIPPAWAKTKETLLPLARTIVETFERARQPIVVLRLDGIRRRGESYNDPECQIAGCECHHMTFSQGVEDIQTALDFVESSPDFQASQVVLVTFSGASIEARKVLSEEATDRVVGWVSVVGAADLRSGLRVVSGGQDFIGGWERGVRFGIQRVLGIETDADRVCRDAVEHGLAYLEDARRQMKKVRTPITWIQGRHDAWIDPRRVREILSCGDTSRRRLVEVPTGHQLRTSREALDAFQLIAAEVGRFVTGRQPDPVSLDLVALERRRQAERARIAGVEVDLRKFWRDYLLGRGECVGIDLLTATSPYRELMKAQLRALDLHDDDLVVDLGSGTGMAARILRDDPSFNARVVIHELDYLREALESGRAKLGASAQPVARFLACTLSLETSQRARFVPVADATYDAALASLLLNYVAEPDRLINEMRRMLRPGARLVLSVLKPDTDISKIYVDAAAEIRAGRARDGFSSLTVDQIEESVRSFLNDAGRLLDLEERGLFQFWEPEDLIALVGGRGFRDVRVWHAFGDPPQALILSAVAR